jgi:Ras-related protein Rab-5C
VVYDITSAESFAGAKTWIEELQRQGSADIVIGLAGNKADMENKREVARTDAEAYAAENGCIFFETSAKTGANVQQMFAQIAQRLPKQVAPQTADDIQIISPDEDKKKSCC